MTRRVRNLLCLFGPALMVSVALTGCSGEEKDFGARKDRRRTEPGTGTGVTDGAQTAALTPIKSDKKAVLKGVVKLVPGNGPDLAKLTADFQTAINKDREVCLAADASDAEKEQYSWRVDKETQGLDNVFVWIRPEDDTKQFFDVSELVEKGEGFEKSVVLDQPHCAFLPHGVVLFPQYVDPENPPTDLRTYFRKPPEQKGAPRSGQQFRVINSAPIAHNTSWDGESTRMRVSGGTLPPKSGDRVSEETVNTDAKTGIQPSYTQPVQVKCSIHPWMQGVVWAFDHPFAAVSGDKGKKWGSGEYRIEHIPAGVKLRVVVWHERAGFLKGEKGEVVELKEGDNEMNLEIPYSQ